ncbi:MAG: glycosyltransferase family 2 protein, partial [Clostridia bacterium]|nr:glycosyltransferase family 2 protein [Clostridia bacterium]
MPSLSIITPTYNRGYLLPVLFHSLEKQTCFDFEWILVDDGSDDDTEAVAKTFFNDLFPFVYIKKENGGKHTALNASHPYVKGKYVLILDSDDYLTEDAV